jgi:hypothetical protein
MPAGVLESHQTLKSATKSQHAAEVVTANRAFKSEQMRFASNPTLFDFCDSS